MVKNDLNDAKISLENLEEQLKVQYSKAVSTTANEVLNVAVPVEVPRQRASEDNKPDQIQLRDSFTSFRTGPYSSEIVTIAPHARAVNDGYDDDWTIPNGIGVAWQTDNPEYANEDNPNYDPETGKVFYNSVNSGTQDEKNYTQDLAAYIAGRARISRKGRARPIFADASKRAATLAGFRRTG